MCNDRSRKRRATGRRGAKRFAVYNIDSNVLEFAYHRCNNYLHKKNRISYRQRILLNQAAAHGQDVWRVEALIHRRRLARVDHEEDLIVPGKP